jgi:hypothetical protein
MVLAHRAAWEHHRGAIPADVTVDHVCKNKRCVNPGHLRLLDNFENGRRTFGRDWELGTCARGHSNELLVTLPSGRRRCATCRSEDNAAYRARQKSRAA